MSSQIFKQAVASPLLIELLERVCLKTDKYYLFDMNAFRKIIFNEYQIEFCQKLKPYYHLGKQFYLDRKMAYNTFTTILRQICKHNAIMFTSQIKYNESKYNIDYLIYY